MSGPTQLNSSPGNPNATAAVQPSPLKALNLTPKPQEPSYFSLFTSAAASVASSVKTFAATKGAELALDGLTFLVTSDKTTLEQGQKELEALGFTGAAALDINETIEKTTDSFIASQTNPIIKKVIASSPHRIVTIETAVKTVVTKMIANLANQVKDHKTKNGTAFAPTTFDNLLKDVLELFTKKAEGHFKGTDRQYSMHEEIARIESSALPEKEKKEKFAELFSLLTNDMVQSALPNGLKSIGLDGFVVNMLGDYLLKSYLPNFLANQYTRCMFKSEDLQKVKKELQSSPEGQFLLDSVTFGLNSLLAKNPKVAGLGASAAPMIESLVIKLATNISNGETVTPLQSSLKNITDFLANFYLTDAAQLKEIYQASIKYKAELATSQASVVHPSQAAARTADIDRLTKLVADCEASKTKIFLKFAKQIWTLLKFDNEKSDFLLDIIKNIIVGEISGELGKTFDSLFKENPGVLCWITPEKDPIQKEIDSLDLGSSVEPLAKALSQLLFSPAPKILSGLSDQIADMVLKPLNASLPILSPQMNTYIKQAIVTKLQSLAANPTNTDPLWLFVQNNIKGLALDIVKAVAGNKRQADVIRALSALPEGGPIQDVIDLLKVIKDDLKGDVEAFHQQHGAAIATAQAALPANPTPAETNAYQNLFQPLNTLILNKTGLGVLLSKNSRLAMFGLDTELSKLLLSVTIDLYKKTTQPTQAQSAPVTPVANSSAGKTSLAPIVGTPASTINPKQGIEHFEHAIEIIGRHFNGLGDPTHPTGTFAESIAAIESSSLDAAAKKKAVAELFKPMVDELNKDKKLADFLLPLLSSVIGIQVPAQYRDVISPALGSLCNEFMPMLPSIMAFFYPLFGGSSNDGAIRKDLLNQSNEGKILLAAVSHGSKKLLNPLLNSLLKTLSGDKTRDFRKDPVIQHLVGLGSYLSENILTAFFINIAGHDTTNPLQSLFTNLKDLIGSLYQDNLVPLKYLYEDQIETKRLLAKCSPTDAAELQRLNDHLADTEKAKMALLKPIIEAIWESGEFATIPPFNLVPNMAFDLIHDELSMALNNLIDANPGVLRWINPEKNNAFLRTELALVENNEICTALGTVAPVLVTEGLKGMLIEPKKTNPASTPVAPLAITAAKAIATALTLDDDLKDTLQSVIALLMKDLSTQDPLWDLLGNNIEGIILELFNSMSIKQAGLGKAIFKLATGSNIVKGYNPLEALAGELLEQAQIFQTNHGAAVEKDYAKDLGAIRLARLELAKAKTALSDPPSDSELAAFKDMEKALEVLETAFYARFKPIADGLVSSLGLDVLLSKDGRFGIFSELINKQLLSLCADVYHQVINPLNEKAHINHNLGIALFDANRAAMIAQGNDDKAARLRKAGIRLDGADFAKQKEILDASGATTTAELAEQLGEMLAGVIENETQKYLVSSGTDIANELNGEVFEGKLSDKTVLQIIGNGIQNLSKATTNGTKGLFKYFHAILVPALSKGMINVFNSVPEAVNTPPGEHSKLMLPLNIILQMFETMHDETAVIEKNPAFMPLREQIWTQEERIKVQEGLINKAKLAVALNNQNLKPLEDELKELQTRLSELNSQLGQLFQPLTAKLLGFVSAENNDVSNPAHPLHDATILPEKTRNVIWNKLLPSCLGIFLGTHYHTMHPKTEPLKDQIKAISGNNKLNIFADYMEIVARDGTPDSLTKEPHVLASDLTGTILAAFQKAPTNAPDYVKALHETLSTHQGTLKHFLESFFKVVGSSKLEVFQSKLWPSLARFTLPMMQQLILKVATKLKQHDRPEIRTKLVIDFMKMLNAHAKTSNVAAAATKNDHPHEVPVDQMFDQFKKAGQLHPVIDQVMASSPEQESAIRKAYFTQYAKEFFATIGLTKDDLPFTDAEKGAAWKLFEEEIAPMIMGITFDSIVPGKTRNSIEGDLFNTGIKDLLEEYEKRTAAAKAKAKATGDRSALHESLPEISSLLSKDATKNREDADQAKLDEELGNLLVNELRMRIPDLIAHEQLIIKPLLQANAKDLGAIIREKLCENGSLVGLFSSLGINVVKALFKGKYDPIKDVFNPEQVKPEFHPVSATTEKVSKTAKDAHAIGTRVVSNLLCDTLEDWFNSVLENIARTINLALLDLYAIIDKISKKTKHSEAMIKGIKNAVWYIGWGLFYATLIPWLVTLIARKFVIPVRVGANAKNIQQEVHAAYNRNFFYHAADRMLDRRFAGVTAIKV